MKAYLDWIGRAVADKLNQDAIGKPVFARVFLRLSADHGTLEPLAAAAVRMAAEWLRATPTKVYAQGGARDGHVSAMVEMDRGQTAMVSVEALPGEPSAMLLILGQRGSFRFDDYPEPLPPSPLEAPAREADAIRRSLASKAAEVPR